MTANSIDTNLEFVAVGLLFALTITSINCGFLTLYIIHSMNTWNGYVLLVFALASCHLLYNFCYFLRFDDDVCPYKAISSASGTAVCLWINTMSIIIFYTAMYQVSFRVKPFFWHLVVIIMLCSIAIGLIEGIVCSIEPNYYSIYWTFFVVRLGSIIFNSLVYLIVTFSLNLPYQSHIFGWTLSDFAVRRKTNELIIVLVSRLRYYPIVQIITGACGIWWDLQFGFNPEPQDHYTITQQACTYLYAVTFPFAGIGYFLIFLYVQPSAMKLLHNIVQKVCCCCLGSRFITVESKDVNSSSMKHPPQYDTNRISSPSKDVHQDMEITREQYHSTSSVNNPQPFHINHMSDSDVDAINSFDTDDYRATGLSSSSSVIQPPRIDSNSMTSSYDRTASSANGSGWLRWNSRISSSYLHQPNARVFNFSRDFGYSDNNQEVPIPAFILENDLNEDLIIEELQRRLNSSNSATVNVQNALHTNNS